MERKKFSNEKPKQGIFPEALVKRTKQGMQAGVDKLVADVTNYMIPALREAGYKAKLIRSEDLLRRQKEKEYEKWSEIPPRTLLKGDKGWWLEICQLERPAKWYVCKPCVIESTKHLSNHPRWNLTKEFLKELENFHQNIWIRAIWNKWYALDSQFLIMTKTGKFWLGAYTSISDGGLEKLKGPCGWYLTYRSKDHSKIDRIATLPEAQTGGHFQKMSKLRDALLTQMHYWTINNEYHANR